MVVLWWLLVDGKEERKLTREAEENCTHSARTPRTDHTQTAANVRPDIQ